LSLPRPAAVNPDENLIHPPEAARFLALSDSWLAKSRVEGDGPKFIKIGRAVRYRRSDLIDYLNRNVHTSTSQEPENFPRGRKG
jgi:predicted DNA-binding transcriptional regulator AlpA